MGRSYSRTALAIAALLVLSTAAHGQTAGSHDAVSDGPVPATPADTLPISTLPALTLPAMTPVDLEIMADITSKTGQIGAMFPIRLAAPITIDGHAIVPAGITGEGEVVHAARARAAGKAGELILAARYLDWNGTRIPLRSFKYGRTAGQSRTDEAMAAGVIVAAPLMLLIAGGEVVVKPGTPGVAKIASEVVLPAQASH